MSVCESEKESVCVYAVAHAVQRVYVVVERERERERYYTNVDWFCDES